MAGEDVPAQWVLLRPSDPERSRRLRRDASRWLWRRSPCAQGLPGAGPALQPNGRNQEASVLTPDLNDADRTVTNMSSGLQARSSHCAPQAPARPTSSTTRSSQTRRRADCGTRCSRRRQGQLPPGLAGNVSCSKGFAVGAPRSPRPPSERQTAIDGLRSARRRGLRPRGPTGSATLARQPTPTRRSRRGHRPCG